MFVASKQADEQKKLVIEQEVQKRQFQKIEELKTDMQKGVNPFFKVLFDGGNRLFGFPETFIYSSIFIRQKDSYCDKNYPNNPHSTAQDTT
ncbi:cag pathogenicity island E domain protein [Helicobacter pylori NQ4053]|uniref:Cag pathogenicity island E domain protein n=1 Tax=Helicobacter pylori NQ4053 TaxID=992027 RepID=J0JAR0_HELPX|nr:cag pathogenicity island E domain protein [Helicobacter pylori NQ4053]